MIVPVAVLMLVTSVEAKTYDNFAGHSAVQYYQSDMDYPLSEYIERVEYDTDMALMDLAFACISLKMAKI